jgi:MFS family permease
MDNAVAYPKFRFFVAIAETLAFINLGWVIVGFAPLMPSISEELNVLLGTVMIGVLALNGLAGGIGIILCGPLVDRYGPRKVLFVSSILLVICALLIPYFSHNFAQVVVLRLLVGFVGIGPAYGGYASMAQRWFPRKEQSTWIGIWQAGFALGIALMYLAYFPLVKHFEGEWRDVGAFSVVPSALMFVLMAITLFGKEPQVVVRHGGPAEVMQKDFSIALRLPVFWAGGILLGCAQGIMQTVNGLTASYLMTAQQGGLNWKPFLAGPAMSFIQWGMVAGAFLMSTMLIYIFRGNLKWFASFCYLVAGLAGYFLTMSFSRASVSHMEISFFIVGYFMNLGFPAVTTFITQNYPPRILGKVFGVAGGISIFGGAFFSGLAGALLNWTNTFKSVYGLALALGVVACILVAIMLNPIKGTGFINR